MKLLQIVEEVLPALAVAVMTLLASANVVLRYFFSSGIIWATELILVLFIWATFLGSAAVARRHLHVGVEILVDLLKGRPSYIAEALIGLISAVILLVFGIYGLFLTLGTSASLQVLGWSYGVVYAAIPLGCALMFFYALRDVYKNVLLAIRGAVPEGDSREDSDASSLLI